MQRQGQPPRQGGFARECPRMQLYAGDFAAAQGDRLLFGISENARGVTTSVVRRRTSLAEEHHLRERDRLGMRDRDEASTHLHHVGAPCGTAMQPQLRRSPGPDHFDVLPEHAAGVPCAERLHGGFLRGESAGKVRNRIAPARAVGNLGVRKDPPEEAIAIPLQQRRDSRQVRCIQSDSNDVHVCAPA